VPPLAGKISKTPAGFMHSTLTVSRGKDIFVDDFSIKNEELYRKADGYFLLGFIEDGIRIDPRADVERFLADDECRVGQDDWARVWNGNRKLVGCFNEPMREVSAKDFSWSPPLVSEGNEVDFPILVIPINQATKLSRFLGLSGRGRNLSVIDTVSHALSASITAWAFKRAA
jgi:hypothetical protein